LFRSPQGLYGATLVPGDYIINISVPGCQEISDYFSANKGECTGEFKLVKKTPSKLTIKAVDLNTGAPIAGALLKLSTPSRSLNVEALTDENGKSNYTTDGLGRYLLTVSREGYITYAKDLCFSKTSLTEITVPLIPIVQESEKTNIQICLSADCTAKGMGFRIYCPQGEEVLGKMKSDSNKNGVQINSKNADKVGISTVINSGANEWYRICAELTDPALTSVSKEKLDRFTQNEMQALNVVAHIIVNGELKYMIYPPSSMVGRFWDIGFINAINGELMGINAIAESAPNNRLELSNEFYAFYQYVSQKSNIRSAFGFDKHGINKLDDVILDAQIFAQTVVKALNLSESSAHSFVNRIVAATADMFGNVCLKLLQRLINIHSVSANDMEYSKSIGSPMSGTATAKKIEFGFLKNSPSTQKIRPPSGKPEQSIF